MSLSAGICNPWRVMPLLSVAEVSAHERQMQNVRFLNRQVRQVGVREVTLDRYPIEIGLVGQARFRVQG